jgi:hypothetical protein
MQLDLGLNQLVVFDNEDMWLIVHPAEGVALEFIFNV